MIFRLIAPPWLLEENPGARRTYEGEFSEEETLRHNAVGYNIYFLPNYPSHYEKGTTVTGAHIDIFRFVFIDMDLKDGTYATKQDFISYIQQFPELTPTFTVDSGGGIHAYWQVDDLDAMSYLRLQRRLMRHFNTDPAVGQIFQLMRVPGTVNMKDPTNPRLCEYISESDAVYTCEQLDKLLPPITLEDEEYCKHHFDKTYNLTNENIKINDTIPNKFHKLVRDNREIKEIWSGNVEDRSAGDFRMGHIMHADGFTKAEAMSVLVNTSKALSRAPIHRVSYAENIVDKIWTFEATPDKDGLDLSSSVRDILSKHGDNLAGTRLPSWRYIDATDGGFRLGQVLGLAGGSGIGKTSTCLNLFMGFVRFNPDYIHFFISLEQPAKEIANRWKRMCGPDTHLHDKVHIIDNHNDDGSFRHLSMADIREYLLKFQEKTGKKVGCVVIDHIGVLNKENRNGENQGLMDICRAMKPFAVELDVFLIMQSQAPREKAGIGDLELDKDAAYGTVFFESYCDFLLATWQPLKRCHSEEACPTATAFKFCKIRHKRQGLDKISEDVPYYLFFDPKTELLREMTQAEEESFRYFNQKATNKRKADKKTDLVQYAQITWTKDGDGATDSNKVS